MTFSDPAAADARPEHGVVSQPGLRAVPAASLLRLLILLLRGIHEQPAAQCGPAAEQLGGGNESGKWSSCSGNSGAREQRGHFVPGR